MSFPGLADLLERIRRAGFPAEEVAPKYRSDTPSPATRQRPLAVERPAIPARPSTNELMRRQAIVKGCDQGDHGLCKTEACDCWCHEGRQR